MEQQEKYLLLTWKDIDKILEIGMDVTIDTCEKSNGPLKGKEYCVEIARRFNELKK